MTEAEVINEVKAGSLLLVGTFLGSEPEARSLSGKSEKGRPWSFVVLGFTVFANGVAVHCESRWNDTGDKSVAILPCKPMTPCVVKVTSFNVEKGIAKATGTVFPLEQGAVPPSIKAGK